MLVGVPCTNLPSYFILDLNMILISAGLYVALKLRFLNVDGTCHWSVNSDFHIYQAHLVFLITSSVGCSRKMWCYV